MAPAARPFAKPALSHVEQVALLQRRGLVVDDPVRAEHVLAHINYYRLAAYWLPFEEDHDSHRFRPGTRFDDVLRLYSFDRELRLLALDALERIEVSIRSQWAYGLATRHGSHAYLDPQLATRRDRWERNIESLQAEVGRSDETFIKHFRARYTEELPPVWAVSEIMSMGLLSRWYNNLKPMPVRSAIASTYALDEKVLESWLHHLSIVRNTCAHHGRLYNREFAVTPVMPRTKPQGLRTQLMPQSRGLYNSLVIMLHLMDRIAPQSTWRHRLVDLLGRDGAPLGAMRFPANWGSMPIWQSRAG